MVIGHDGLVLVVGCSHFLTLPDCLSCPLFNYMVNVHFEFTYFHHLNPFDLVKAITDKYRFSRKYGTLLVLLKSQPHIEREIPDKNGGK